MPDLSTLLTLSGPIQPLVLSGLEDWVTSRSPLSSGLFLTLHSGRNV